MPAAPLAAAATGLPTHTLPTVTEIVPGYIAHKVDDNRAAPLLSEGDYVVVDTGDTMPVPGGMFLVEWSNGRRSLMSTRPTACERRLDEQGRAHLFMRKDGPGTVWYFDPLIAPRSKQEIQAWIKAGRMMGTSDGPYDLDYMRSKIVGRLVGVVDGEAATEWAVRQVGDYEIAIDRQAKKAAEGFDPELWIDLRDRTGQVSVLTVNGGKLGILAWFVDHDSDETTRIYKEHRAVFDAERDGHAYSHAQPEAALRKAGRVMTLKPDGWHPDPKMPAHVRAAHCPEVRRAVA